MFLLLILNILNMNYWKLNLQKVSAWFTFCIEMIENEIPMTEITQEIYSVPY